MGRSRAKKAWSIPGVRTGAYGKIRISDSHRRDDSDWRVDQLIVLPPPAKRV